MSLFLTRRFLSFILTLWGASVIVFAMLEILPGDPALTMLGVDAPESAVLALRQELGLDRPAWERYSDWIAGIFHWELGTSYTYKVPVTELVAARLEVTLPLALSAMVLAAAIALSLGLYAASRHNRLGDYGVMGFSQLGLAVPDFWFGILLIIAFAILPNYCLPGLQPVCQFVQLPAGGFPGWDEGIGAVARALLLPVAALTLSLAAILTRITRSAVLEVWREDFVRTARAKGLARRATLWRHVLRNALIPVITIMGLMFANVMAGTIVIENVFSLPGMGNLIFGAISNRDLEVVKNVVLMLAGLVVIVNFVVDILYAVIDPRIRVRG
jgi:peptide/nickel transport system permease protein